MEDNARKRVDSPSIDTDVGKARWYRDGIPRETSPTSPTSPKSIRRMYLPATPMPVTPPKPHIPLRRQSSEQLRGQAPPQPSSPLKETALSAHPVQESPTKSASTGLRRRSSAPRLRRDAQFDSSPTDRDDVDSAAYPAATIGPLGRMRGQTTSQVRPPSRVAEWSLKAATSIPDLGQSQLRSVSSSIYRPDRGQYAKRESRSSLRRDMAYGQQPSLDDLRAGTRSIRTTGSSSCLDASTAERSSIATKDTAFSDMTQASSLQYDTEDEEGMSVDDVFSLYAHGFTDDPQRATMFIETSSDSGYGSQIAPIQDVEEKTHIPIEELEQQHTRQLTPPPIEATADKPLPLPKMPTEDTRSSHLFFSGRPPSPSPLPKPVQPPVPSRDRYGFKKAGQHVSEADYDAWNVKYQEHLDRRRKKWMVLMKQHGLSTEDPIRFPAKSDKVKRYVRKGIPPDWRGAAWFWYAGGPKKLAERPGLYDSLLKQADAGALSEHDREQMERDLHRTFPDNAQFKPDDTSSNSRPDSSIELETPIVSALRRVLRAFAVHNPSIGYCQSLNFLAGLLLLFLNSDEEKAFVLLCILCNDYLPGAHGRVLESSVDVGVLMMCIRELMPAIWEKIDDQPQERRGSLGSMSRLPTVSLATTAWFMSCFVGNLPIECVLRVWDVLFYEGSKTLFRIALTIFKLGEIQIRAVTEHMEIFQVVQQMPRTLLDANMLMEACYKRRNGFGHLNQEVIDARRQERRAMVKDGTAGMLAVEPHRKGLLNRSGSKGRMKRSLSRRRG